MSLDVKMERTTKPPGRIDAVIVVEHRNLTEVILQESLDVKDVIIIMTAGFPDSATKEIIHLLSTNKRMERTPFLYFGDHDTAGYTIFQCLKYGSRTSAWVSPISVCPQLVYAGPTIEDLKVSAARFRSLWEVQYKEGKPNATDAQVKTAADTWQKTTEQQINDKLTSLTSKDKQTLTSFKKLGWLAHEDVIQGEIAAMEKGKGVSAWYIRASSRLADWIATGIPLCQPCASGHALRATIYGEEGCAILPPTGDCLHRDSPCRLTGSSDLQIYRQSVLEGAVR